MKDRIREESVVEGSGEKGKEEGRDKRKNWMSGEEKNRHADTTEERRGQLNRRNRKRKRKKEGQKWRRIEKKKIFKGENNNFRRKENERGLWRRKEKERII